MVTRSEPLTRLSDRLDHMKGYWRARQAAIAAAGPQAPTIAAPSIAITREAGCPGTVVAHEVGRRLGWEVYDHEILEHIAKEMGLRVSLLENVDERRQSWLLESMKLFTSLPEVSESRYVYHLLESLFGLATQGQCVFVGRGAAQVLPRQTTLCVRLIAPEEWRIAEAARRYKHSLPEATRRVHDLDRERAAFIRDHFRKDLTDPHGYDLLLNMARWSEEQCAEQIVRAVEMMRAG